MIKVSLMINTINWENGEFYILGNKEVLDNPREWTPYSTEIKDPLQQPISYVKQLFNQYALMDTEWAKFKILSAEFKEEESLEILYYCTIPYNVEIAIETNEWINVNNLLENKYRDHIVESTRSIS